MVGARIRIGAQWGDARILNVSSRGMLIQSGQVAPKGSEIELWRGDLRIVARVVWRNGSQAGLVSEDRLPVDEILSINQSGALQLVAIRGQRVERRKKPRHDDAARSRGRAIEFIGVGAVAITLVAALGMLVEQTFVQTIAQAEASLGRG
jgi:hypothetical protein